MVTRPCGTAPNPDPIVLFAGRVRHTEPQRSCSQNVNSRTRCRATLSGPIPRSSASRSVEGT